MIDDEPDAHRPLPVVLKQVDDELLSSWLALGLAQVARLSEKLQCDPIALIAMTFIDTPADSADLICRNKAPQICRPCADRYAREGASDAVQKHWRKAWRITCPACSAPLSDTNEHPDSGETLRDTSPFADVWKEAVAGEAIIERFLHGAGSFDYSPIVLMRALLVQTWRPCGANGRAPAVGWTLGTIFPEFDNLARPIKRRINLAAVAALPISFRPAGAFGGRFANDLQSSNPQRCSR